MALKQLSRYRLSVVNECADCKRKVITILDQVFPEYEKLFSYRFHTYSQSKEF
ncbi:hypothetical protein AGMMS49957_18360 [Synergistales bacterium]|nr:hypothetical protein AGMMS49957_18360 [Synergistales bacterium]